MHIEKAVMNYVKDELKNNRRPTYREVNKLFKINKEKIKLSNIYFKLGFDILNFPAKRPNKSYHMLKEKILEYVRKEIAEGHYPSRREIEKLFRVRLFLLFDGIEDLYSKSGSRYLQKSSHELKIEKSKALLKIALDDILPKLNLVTVEYSKVHQHGADIVAKDIFGKLIVIELKAYNKFEPIKEKDVNQVRRFLSRYKTDKAIIITTTNKIQKTVSIPKNIRVIDFEELKNLISTKYAEKLEFIRLYSIHRETNEINSKREKIIQYAKQKYSEGKEFSCSSILKELHIDTRTCFGSIYEIYKETGIPLPPKKIKGLRAKIHDNSTAELKKKILQYVKEQVQKGNYPSGISIGQKFGISHIWNFIKVSEIYHSLGLPAYHERKTRKYVTSSPLP